MECKHSYFHIVEGKLRCAQCNLTLEEIKSGNKPQIEDKIGERTENKKIWPQESKRVGRPPKRR